MKWNPNGSLLASCSDDTTVKVQYTLNTIWSIVYCLMVQVLLLVVDLVTKTRCMYTQPAVTSERDLYNPVEPHRTSSGKVKFKTNWLYWW